MNYDEIILECLGDCANCKTYLECQYQTSPESEKAGWLAKIRERDEALKAAAENEAIEEAIKEEVVEEAAAEEAPQEEIVEETAPIEEAEAIDEPIAEEITDEETAPVEEQIQEEVVEEATAEEAPQEEVVEETAPIEEAEAIEEPIAEEITEEETAPVEEQIQEEIVEEAAPIEEAESIDEPIAEEATAEEVIEDEEESTQDETDDEVAEEKEEAPVEEVVEKGFKLTPPENNEELLAAMCAKRGRKLVYRPNEAIITVSCKVLGTDKKNDIGEKVKDILDAEIKQGTKLGYLDKFDGLKSSEIKEEYEDDIVYEYADQEFKKTGVIYDGKDIKVYLYDWDLKACHHVGKIDAEEAKDIIPYLLDKENYSFDVCGIITGGKGKRVIREGETLKIVKEKGDPIGLDVDITVINRKD